MKFRLTLLFVLFISYFSSNAHDKITFQNKESFNTSCYDGKLCTSFDLGEIKGKNSLKEANQFVKENVSLISSVVRDTKVQLTVQSGTDVRIIYEKLFHLLGLQEIEILEGDAKGVYTVTEFLNLYSY